jgi:hypothetical protein
MQDDCSRDEDSVPADAYLRDLSLASVSEEKKRWYVRWAERFAEFLGEKPLDAAERRNAEAFIALLGGKPRAEAWQIRQATDAVRILPTALFDKPWLTTGSGFPKDGDRDVFHIALVQASRFSSQRESVVKA